MKSFFKFLAVCLVILFASALLTPWLFTFLPYKFEKIFNRLVMVSSVAAAILFVRIRRETFADYGLLWRRDRLSLFLTGFWAAFLTLVILTGVRMVLGSSAWAVHEWKWRWIWRIVRYLGAALLIGTVEEFFFRGFIFRTLKDRFAWGMGWSVAGTSLFYSLVHFLNEATPLIGPEPTVWDSLRLMAAPFLSLADWRSIAPAALGLFLFGLILNGLVIRTRTLYPAIGVHAGGVFFLKIDGFFVDSFDVEPLYIGTNQMIDGMLGWFALALLAVALQKMIKGTALCLFLITVGLPSALAVRDVEIEALIAKSAVAYRLVDHLADAETIIWREGKRGQKGLWKDNRFYFHDFGEEWEIRAISPTIQGETRAGIYLYLYPGQETVRRLQFHNVPPGKRLVLQYSVRTENGDETETSYVYLRLWVGRHELKRFRFSQEKGWRKEEIDLGVISFLKRDVTLTFEIAADEVGAHHFVFNGEILK